MYNYISDYMSLNISYLSFYEFGYSMNIRLFKFEYLIFEFTYPISQVK